MNEETRRCPECDGKGKVYTYEYKAKSKLYDRPRSFFKEP